MIRLLSGLWDPLRMHKRLRFISKAAEGPLDKKDTQKENRCNLLLEYFTTRL